MASRRRHERFPTDILCRLFVPADKGKTPKFEAHARLRDLSLGGVFVEADFKFKKTIDIFVELHLPDGKLPVRGRVVRQPDGGLGIAFNELTVKDRERILLHFVPSAHRRFHEDVVSAIFPKLGVDRVSLILHLWDEFTHPSTERSP